MASLVDTLNQRLARVARVRSTVGVFVAMVGGLARVNVQGGTVDIRCDGWYPPIPGMPVRVDTVNSVMRVVGPSQTLSPRGEVVESVESGVRARIVVDGAEYTLPVMAPYVPVPTDVVVVNWVSGHVLGEEASPPEPPAPPPPTGGGAAPFTELLIQPTASGKYDDDWSNWWGAEILASNNNKSIWTYGYRFGALAGANVTKAELCFPRPIRAVGALYVGLHSYPQIPGGAPTITDLVAVPQNRREGWLELPSGWGNQLRDEPGWGVGVTSGAGENRWPGVGQAGGAQSGWLRFAGTR